MSTVAIFGTSGFAREVGDVADALGHPVIYIARDQAEVDGWKHDCEVFLESDVARYSNLKFAIGVGANPVRRAIADKYRRELAFLTLIHPAASFGRNQREVLESSVGSVVCSGVRFTNNIAVGDFCIFNLNSTVGHDVEIGDYANIAPGACISGNVVIGDGCWVGSGAVINQGAHGEKLEVGANTTIGSGAVVAKGCDPNAVYVGVPAKRIK